MELQSIRHIIRLQFCISTQHPYFHPASLVLLTNFHPASRHFPPSIPVKNTTIVSYLLGHITFLLAVNRDKLTSYVRIPDQICVKQAQCCQLACHKIATNRAPPCLMLGGIPPASLSEGCLWHFNDCPSASEVICIEHWNQWITDLLTHLHQIYTKWPWTWIKFTESHKEQIFIKMLTIQ